MGRIQYTKAWSFVLAATAVQALATGCEQDYRMKLAPRPLSASGASGTDQGPGSDSGGNGDGKGSQTPPSGVQPIPTVNALACAATEKVQDTLPYAVSEGSTLNANVVFAIDTSGSMADEAAQLKTNLASFVAKIKNEALAKQKIRFVVIGTEGDIITNGGTLLEAPYQRDKLVDDVYWHHNLVFSQDKLQAVMGAYGMTSYNANGASRNINTASYKPLPDLKIQAGSPCSNPNLYECQAINHVVVVTDDNEVLAPCSAVSDTVKRAECVKNGFKSSFEAHLDKTGSSLRFHAIHYRKDSLATATCKAGRTGDIWTTYDQLTAETKGLSLDVCQKDWSSIFDQLKDRIVNSADPASFVQCAKSDRELVQVSLKLTDGRLVPLALKDVVYTAPKGAAAAAVYVAPAILLAKGVMASQVASLVVESQLK